MPVHGYKDADLASENSSTLFSDDVTAAMPFITALFCW